MDQSYEYTGYEIAVIGMAVKFPGARNVDEFWHNLKSGIESIHFFSGPELLEFGLQEEMTADAGYVKAGISVAGKDHFDYSFFGYIPEEAQLMNPQTRLFHECVWHALEDAGYTGGAANGRAGLFAGAGDDFGWQAYSMLKGIGVSLDAFTSLFLRSKDSLTTRISYKLDLEGPSVTLNTACSTSLVAIHMACRSLISGECDIALAGGVTIVNSSPGGYYFQEGMILSPDGHCRVFDINAKGTLAGEGAGVVVLKPLDTALEDRDNIYAVVKGSAVNNDGGIHKVGYTAPSVKGQVKAIRDALVDADVPHESISYIESHGTGTVLGDPIEMKALHHVYGKSKEKYCAVGSVKSNIGHLDTAAGVAGFIKTVLALKHNQIPASLHFREPNPKIEFDDGPFYVNRGLKEWENSAHPRRAGISSFGIGGTNAHVILEEAPAVQPSPESREYQVIVLSARTADALNRMTENLSLYFERNRDITIADVAFTLQAGREASSHRRMFVSKDIDDARKILSSPASGKIKTYKPKKGKKSVVFMFPGQGSQYVNMGLDLYRSESLFRDEIDRCSELFAPLLGFDLRRVLYTRDMDEGGKGDIDSTSTAQPILFSFEYALAKLMIAWGIKPDYMIGYSYGEYVAACIAGVISLQDAVRLVALRGRLMEKLPPGAMLSVPLPASELVPLLNVERSAAAADGVTNRYSSQKKSAHENKISTLSNKDLSLAIDNGPSCIVAGNFSAVEGFEKRMRKKGLLCMNVKMAHAGHSKMVEPILGEFEQILGQIKLHVPEIPYISCTSGNWITGREALDPLYWIDHLRSTVKFSDGLDLLLKEKGLIFIEVGAGKALSNLVRQKIGRHNGHQVINLTRNEEEAVPDLYYLLERTGRLWLYGKEINWQEFYRNEKRNRISLPAYPFEKIPCPVGESLSTVLSQSTASLSPVRSPDISDWFYVPSWKKSILYDHDEPNHAGMCNLVFIDNRGIGAALIRKFVEKSEKSIAVKPGKEYRELSDLSFIINPESEKDFTVLFRRLREKGYLIDRIIHFWSLNGGTDIEELTVNRVQSAQITGFYSLLNIAGAAGQHFSQTGIGLYVFTDNMQDVNKTDMIDPGKSTMAGAVKVIPREYPNVSCRCIDILLPGPENISEENLINLIYEELNFKTSNMIAAYRGLTRWEQTLDQVKLTPQQEPPPAFKEQGVYLITGGLGGMGLTFAEYLGRVFKARLILTGRSSLPAKSEWENRLVRNEADDAVSKKIVVLQELEKAGAEIIYLRADTADHSEMEKKINEAERHFGPVNGIIHAAGIIDYGGVIHNREKKANEEVFSAKIYGTLVLNDIFRGRDLDFFILCSSISAIMPSFGEVGYASANMFLDAFARYRLFKEQPGAISINWSIWNQVGMGYRAYLEKNPGMSGNSFAHGIYPRDGIDILTRTVRRGLPQLVVSAVDLNSVLESHEQIDESRDNFDNESQGPGRDRPELLVEYAAPETTTQEVLANLWESFFGIKEVGIDDDFFELGGDSLKAMSLAARIHRTLSVEIPLAEFFKRPAIRALAEYIEDSGEEDFTPVRNEEKKEYYPLSSAQKRLFILQQIDMQSITYNESRLVYLGAEIDKDRVVHTVEILLKRHESLRTSFIMVKEEPVQVVHRQVTFSLEYYDAGDMASGSQAGDMEDKLLNLMQPFDLSKPSQMRVILLKTVDKKYILIFYYHHIIADGISQVILEREFLSIYRGEELPASRFQYRDFVGWERNEKQQELLKQSAEYWIDQFSGEIPVLQLPLDYPRPIMQSFVGSTVSFVLNREETKHLRQLVKEQDVTLYMSLLAIFTILLAKLSGQEDIVVGTPVGARLHVDIEQIVGMFVNTVTMRNRIPKEMTFNEFLEDLKTHSLEAFDNQGYRFEDLVDRVSLRRDTGRNPIFDVMFNLVDSGERTVDISDSNEIANFVHRKSNAKFDLNVTAVDYDEVVYFDFEYCTKLFKPDAIERMIGYFKSILSKVIAKPAIRIGDIEVISEGEKNQILKEFNNTDAGYPYNKNVCELISEQAERRPDSIMVVGPGQNDLDLAQVSYKELEERSRLLASLLKEKGSGPQVIVAIMPERSVEMVAGILGILKTGGAYLPIDTDYPQERIRYMLRDSGAELLLTQGEFLDVYKDICEGIDLYDDIYGCEGSVFHRDISSDLAYVTYTSGSTGKPKGVMIRHMSLVNFVKGITDVIVFRERDIILSLTTICFDIFGLEILLPLARGTRVVVGSLEEQLNPRAAGSALMNFDISILQVTPSRLSLQIEDNGFQRGLKNLRYLLVGGEAFPGSLLGKVRELTNCNIFNLYGPTETTIWSAMKDVSGKELLNIGKPISNTSIYIVDSGYHLQPVGVTGELCIAGDGLSPGYVNRPELTAEKFIKTTSNKSFVGSRGGFSKEPLAAGGKIYRTGDLARWLPDGNIDFLGRIDQQVKLRGFRIELEEIERILTKHERIREALVVLKGDKDENRYLCAYIVLVSDNGKPPDHTGLREYVSQFLPDYMAPSYFVPIDKIPLTANGKIDRKSLPDPVIAAADDYIPPVDEMEERLVDIWSQVLGVESGKISVAANFFELGGNSLNLIRMNHLINDSLKIDIPVGEMFRLPNIRAMANYIESGDINVQVSDKMIGDSVSAIEETMRAINSDN